MSLRATPAAPFKRSQNMNMIQKTVIVIALFTVLGYGFIFTCFSLISGCDDLIVTSHYATRSEAEADRLFERGWLPSIIPQSSRDITTINDLDLNYSDGEFRFGTEGLQPFISELTKLEVTKQGYQPFEFEDESSRWVFLIDPLKGHCKYRMGLKN